MNDTIKSLIRQALTFGGGILVGKGILSASDLTNIVGPLTDAIGAIAVASSVIWSVSHHTATVSIPKADITK